MPKDMSRVQSLGWKAEPKLYPPPLWRVVNKDRFLIGSVLSRAPEEESPTGLASWHSRWLALCRLEPDPSTSLRSLRSRPITALPSYYGRSDSCPRGSSSLPGEGFSASRNEQVSLIHVPGLPIIPSPTTRCAPGTAFPRYPSALRASLLRWVLDFAFRTQARQLRPAVSSLLSYGLIFHPLLLSTPPHGDAVAVGFQAGERIPGEDFHLSGQARFQAH